MVPSARQRFLDELSGWSTEESRAITALERAYRDGFLAAVARLREGSIFNAARSKVMGLPDWTAQTGVTNVEMAGDIVRAVLAAVAAKLGGGG
jgi:hypothetical protein